MTMDVLSMITDAHEEVTNTTGEMKTEKCQQFLN